MKDLRELDHLRYTEGELDRFGKQGGRHEGVFIITRSGKLDLRIIADAGQGWDHVSVSTAMRCPTWEEMDMVKDMFFKVHEVAMQLHVPKKDHINIHPFTLHLWRPHKGGVPRPDGWRV
jgi:hypothetical protein